MKKYCTYREFYERVVLELRDKLEASDLGENDNSKMFPFVNGMWITSECINELLIESKNKRKRVVEYVFDSDTHILELPHNIGFLFGIRPTGTGQWLNISDSSDLTATYIAIAEDTIKNTTEEGWKKGDILELEALVFPDKITVENDPVVFPPEHEHLLRMRCIINAFNRAEKDIPAGVIQTYNECYSRWIANTSKIMAKKVWPQSGFRKGLGS